MTGARAGARIGAEVGIQASRTALRIHCKSSLKYLGILVAAAGTSTTGGYVPKNLTGWSDNSSPDSRGGKESEGVTDGATKGAMEGHSWQKRLRSCAEVILVQTFF